MDGELNRRSVLALSAGGALAAALGACARTDEPTAPRPDVLMFIRHAEDANADGAPPLGVSETGELDKRSLIVQGWIRAGALVGLFDPRDAEGNQLPTRAGILRPTAVFAHDPRDQDSKRSFETVTPLAASLKLPVDTRYGIHETAELSATLKDMHGFVLVAWRHEQIAGIVEGLGNVEPPPPKGWPEDRYDAIFVLTRKGNGWAFTQEPQMILAGDVVTPIS